MGGACLLRSRRSPKRSGFWNSGVGFGGLKSVLGSLLPPKSGVPFGLRFAGSSKKTGSCAPKVTYGAVGRRDPRRARATSSPASALRVLSDAASAGATDEMVMASASAAWPAAETIAFL